MGFFKQMSSYTIGNIVTLFFQWLIIMLIPRITDFTEAGIFAVAISVSSIMNQISLFTLNQYQVADGYEKFSESDYALTRLVTIAISFVCIIPVSILFNYDLNQNLIIVSYTIYRSLINYAFLHVSSLQLKNRLDYVGKSMIIEGFLSFFTFMITYVFTTNLLLSTILMAMVGGGCFVVFMSNGYKSLYGHRYPIELRRINHIKKLIAIGTPLLISTLCPVIITALPKLILENSWGDEIVGIFSTLTAPTIAVPTVLTSMFTPLIVYFSTLSKSGDMGTLRKKYGRTVLLFIGLCILGYVISVLFAGYVFEFLYGPEILPYMNYFNILVVGIFMYSVGMCSITVLITKDQGRYAGICSVISLFISVILFVIVIPEYGMDGAAWGLMAAYGIFGALMTACVFLIPLENKLSPNDVVNNE